MSKFHKTFKNHFELNSEYSITKFPYIDELMTYSSFRQGHCIFSKGSSFVDVSGGDIRDKRVIIKNKDGETFTVNGWQKE